MGRQNAVTHALLQLRGKFRSRKTVPHRIWPGAEQEGAQALRLMVAAESIGRPMCCLWLQRLWKHSKTYSLALDRRFAPGPAFNHHGAGFQPIVRTAALERGFRRP